MDRLADKDLTTATFVAAGSGSKLPARTRTVVIGAGIIGASAALHLAEHGDDDVVVIERGTVGNGTTWHAAGLVSSLRSTPAMTGLAQYGIETYRALQERSGVDVSFTPSGSLMLARTAGRMDELRYFAGVAKVAGVEAQLVDPETVRSLWPLASSESLLAALHLPEDGYLNPGHAAVAFLKLAYERGVVVREGVAASSVLTEAGRVVGVATDHGTIACDRVLLACGLWTRDLAALAGASVPLFAAEHVHARTEPLAGAGAELPVLRDLDGHFYIRPESGRLLIGAFEPDGIPRRVDEIGDAGFAEFPANWEHFAGVRAKANERVPVLREAHYDRFVNAPESFTPDGNFVIGETGEVAGLFVAAGFNSQGIIFAPGAGRAIARWMIDGAPSFDASSVDVRRFARQQGNRHYLHDRTREALGRLYAMHWPHLQPVTARGIRRTPLHARLVAANACFGEMTGWERANWFAPPGTRAEYVYSYGRQNWFEAVREEHRAARERVALFDLSSFTKIEVAGPDALHVLQLFCTADVDLAVGRVRYTLMLNVAGGIELDGTVVRLDHDRFWVITPAATQHKTLELLRRLARGSTASVFDATAGFATLAVMGPDSRELMTRISPNDWSDTAHPYTHVRDVEVADVHATALRVSFVGELGYELYVPADQAINAFDAVLEAGQDLGIRLAGYHALDSLRSEKGYRHLGHDIGPADDPYEAGLGFTVSKKKQQSFVGRPALEARAQRAPRLRTVFVAMQNPELVFVHDEPVLHNGTIVGRMTSGSYGYTLGRACGIAMITADTPDTGRFTIECGSIEYDADVSSTPFYDPDNARLRG